MRHFTQRADVPNPRQLLETARSLKANPRAHLSLGQGYLLGMLFRNPSLRTRLSTQKAATLLGMGSAVLNLNGDAWSMELRDGVPMDGAASEHIREAAPVLGQYCDILALRDFAGLKDREEDEQELLLTRLKELAGVPVVNLESALRHPLQSLADWLTITELKQVARPRVVLTWAPHPRALPQAVPNSFVEWMAAPDAEVDLVIACPEGYELDSRFTAGVPVTHNQDEALADAHFVYAKNWSSYSHYGQLLSQDPAWRITDDKMALTDNARFMHCLPARREVYIAGSVLGGPASAVVQQAGNRTWAAMAVLKTLLENL